MRPPAEKPARAPQSSGGDVDTATLAAELAASRGQPQPVAPLATASSPAVPAAQPPAEPASTQLASIAPARPPSRAPDTASPFGAPPAPATAAPSSEPPRDRLDLARQIVAKLLPPGQYRTLMTAAMADTTTSLVNQMKAPALAQSLATIGIVEGEDLKPEDVAKAVAILDPTYDQRMALATQAVNEGVQDVVAKLEPQMREALAVSYANNFDTGQLGDILHFFDTPTGAAYASRVMLMTTDPSVKALAAQVMPAVMHAMPKIMARAQNATAALPQPRDPSTLSDADRRRVARLLRMDSAGR